MNFKFWQKEEVMKHKSRRLVIPADQVLPLRILRDRYEAQPARQDSEAKYLLWDAIATIFPEVRTGKWRVESPTIFRIEIVEREA